MRAWRIKAEEFFHPVVCAYVEGSFVEFLQEMVSMGVGALFLVNQFSNLYDNKLLVKSLPFLNTTQ